MKSSLDFALLAPVPKEHLEAGLDVVAAEAFVAYGSRKWELFRDLDRRRGDEPVPILIYPSYEDDEVKLRYLIKWTGWYVGHVRSDMGRHLDGFRHRPETVKKYPNDVNGFWAVFWHVAELNRLADDQWKPISSLSSYTTGDYWKAGHSPRGPEIVARPSWI